LTPDTGALEDARTPRKESPCRIDDSDADALLVHRLDWL
jgi:hypothetical protein